MKLRIGIAAVTVLGFCALLPTRGAAQETKPKATPAPEDYSSQAVVVESLHTSAVFREDGTSTITVDARMRVQSQAGVQQFGMLHFPYASATTTLHIDSVRVIKPYKSVIATPAENALDMPADITRQAPFYSDLHELQVVVKGLEAGDTLEFETRADTTKPLDPGEFWNAFNFTRNAIVLDEQLEVSVPRDRQAVVKSATVQPTVTESGATRAYRWETKNLSVTTDDTTSSDDGKFPDVQVSSFQNWEEVGKWFGGLVASRAVVTPDVKAKADELTRGATSETEKIKDIYAFVSTKYRYIGIGLGIGRYQPHAATDVLSNDYGDCKDKHTLFEALLAAEGIKAYPAMVNATAKSDRDVPSPMQFDHVITAIPRDRGYLFLDTTPEVGPFGYLTASVRDKWALVIPDNGAAQLVKTPADPPFPEYFHVRANGTLDDSGTFQGKIQLTLRDDSEVLFRLAFRQAGEPQWETVAQKLSRSMGYGGTVSNVTVTPPDDTETPFQVAYDYNRETYGDWADRKIVAPFPPVYIPAVPDDAAAKKKPIRLGSPEEADYQASVELPADLTPQLPAAVHLSTPFGDYDATYSYALAASGGVLHVERKLVTKVREIKPADREAYGQFVKSIQNDAQQFIALNGAQSSGTGASGSPEATKLYNQGREAAQMRDFAGATDYFQQSVDKDPKFAAGWMALGMMHAATGERSQAEDELRKAIALDPSQTASYQALGALLVMERRFDDALGVWKQLEKAEPSNLTASEAVGTLLLQLRRYPEGVTELEQAVKRNPNDSRLLMLLGKAYSRSGNSAKAVSTFESALKIDSSPTALNNAAYEMADANVNVTGALEDAQKAVSEEESVTAKIDIDNAGPQDFAAASNLAMYWDTLGWAYFRTGDVENAEKYLNAGWRLSQDPTIADHLGQVYEKEGKKRKAIEAYDLAEAAGNAPDHTQARLDALGNTGFDPNAPSIQDLRIVNVNVLPKPKDHASADFIVALSPDGNVKAKFVSGTEELRGADKSLAAAKFDFPFPDQGPSQIVRRGILDCEPELRRCSFAMYPLTYPQLANPTEETTPKLRPGNQRIIVNLTPKAEAPVLSNPGNNPAPSKTSDSTPSVSKH